MTPQSATSWLRLWSHIHPECGEIADLIARMERERERAERQGVRRANRLRQIRLLAREDAPCPTVGERRANGGRQDVGAVRVGEAPESARSEAGA